MPRVRRGGVSLYYERVTGGDESIVFLAGLGVGRWLWHWQRKAFAEEFDLILPDNRGTGNSDVALPELVSRTGVLGYTIEGFAADLEAILADAGIDEAHLVGASMGSMIAQQYALDYDRAETLSLLCTTHGGPESVPIPEETLQQMYDVPEGANKRETIRHRMQTALTDDFFEENPETIEQILDWRLEQDAPEVARDAQGAAATMFDVSDRLQEIEIPTQIIHGTNDRVLPVENAELLAEKLPNSRLELIEGAPHMLMIEASDAVNELLGAFIRNQPTDS